ncbi:MAG: efflux RND transporter periplasmic adaptor subunit [Gemmataceae bacterium]
MKRFAPVLLLFLASCAPKAADTGADKAELPTVTVTVSQLKPMSLTRTVSVVGTLDPYKDVTLSPKVDGRVNRVLRDIGDTVMPGDVLLELDAKEYQLDVEVARAGLLAELSRLNMDALPVGEPDWSKVKSVARAKAALNLAQKEFARAKDERAKGVGTPQGFDKAEAEVELAETFLQVAEADARATFATARKMKASLEKAEDRLRDAVLTAPVPEEWAAWAATVGAAACPLRYTVANRMVWEGEMVRAMPEKNVYRLVVSHVLKLRVTAPEKHAHEVAVGQRATLRVDGFDRSFTGTVSRVSPTVDTLNRTFQVEILVPNGDARAKLKPGTFAKAEIETRTDSGVIAVPPSAVVSFAGVNKVYLADGDKAKAVEVTLGQRDKEWVEIHGAVPAGAKVITSGFSQLVDGSPIKLRQ